MKNTLRLTLLLTALAAIFMACEKNNMTIDNGTTNGNGDNTAIERVIIYTVGGNENRRTLATESEWDAMLDRLCDQAYNGSEVSFCNISQQRCIKATGEEAVKNNQTLSTTSREEMKEWMKKMEKQGLTVCVSYDKKSGTWNGKAYATAPSQHTLGSILGTWHFKCLVMSQLDADGNIKHNDLYEPEAGGGTMYYTFSADGTLTLTVLGMDSTTATDKSKWTLSDDGELSSELLPGGTSWNVSWITPSTMILSRNEKGTEEGEYFYQLRFESIADTK